MPIRNVAPACARHKALHFAPYYTTYNGLIIHDVSFLCLPDFQVGTTTVGNLGARLTSYANARRSEASPTTHNVSHVP